MIFLVLILHGGMPTSFAAEVLLTLGDIKAIFFYANLLPTFLDMNSLSIKDILVVAVITTIAVGGIKAAYALGARKIIRLSKCMEYEKDLKMASGCLLIGAGGYLIVKS